MIEQIATIKLLVLLGYSILFFVLLRSRVPPSVRLHFALYLLGLGFWQFTSLFVTVTQSQPAAVTWYNLQISALGLQSIIFYPLVRVFLGLRRRRFLGVAAYIACAAIVALGILRLGVSHVVAGRAGYYIPVIGPAAYAGSLVSYVFWGMGVSALFVMRRREPLKLQRNRIVYILAGALSVMVGIATDFTFLQAYPADTVCGLINAVLVSYAVTRYRLIDAGTVLKRGLAVTVIVALGVGGFIGLSIAIGFLVNASEPAAVSLSSLAGFVVLLALAMVIWRKPFRPLLDRFAGKHTADFDAVLERFTRKVRSLLDVEELKALLVLTAAETVGSDRGCLLFYSRESDTFTVGSTCGEWHPEQERFHLKPSDDLIRALRERKFPLWEQELLINPGLEYLRPISAPLFAGTETSLAIPIIQEEAVIGILCLGGRKSDGLYGTEDLRFLSTLANVAASSFAVALNYREIERQLSIQTFLFVLSESLVRYVGAEETIRSAIGVLQSFLDVDECFILTLGSGGEARVHSNRSVPSLLEGQLTAVGRALASGKGREAKDAQFEGSLEPGPIDLGELERDSALVRSLEYVPLTSRGEWIGILALDRRGAGRESSGTLAGAFKAILSQGLLAIRHVAELRALKEYNDKVLVSVSTSGEMLLVMDSLGTIRAANSATTDALGFREAELVGRSLHHIVDQDSSRLAAAAFLRDSAARVVQSCELQFRTARNRRVPVLVSSANIVDSDNATQEIVVVARDISRLRNIERGLEESEGRYRALFEGVLDAVVTFRDDGDLIDVNPAGRALFGMAGPGDGGNLPRDFLHEPERFAVLRAELAVRGRLRDFEMRLRTPGGEPRTVLFTGGAEEPSADGRRVINGIFRDVTTQRELQRQLLQAQKMESVGTLAGGIAHDFNNILTAVLGYIHIIRGEVDDREAVLSHIGIIDTSARRAVELTKRLLSFARGGVSDRRPVQLNDIVAEAVQLLRRTMDRSIEITTDCAPDLPRILGDQGQIHQVLINLCVNARDAMPSGGALTVRTRTGALMTDGQEQPPGDSPRGIVVLEVSDTGSGIAQENLSRIFDPFFTTKGPAQGTGLGLSIVYGVVKQHGGQVSVTSVQGKGTTFVLSFPASSEPAAEPAAAPRPAAVARGRETILVVDDETDVRSLVQISLEKLGYRVLEAGDGVEAIEVYKRHEKAIDMALIDLIMPRMGGRETYQRLREMNPGLLALFATGYGMDKNTQDLLATGALGIIQKPYEIVSLESEIRKVLDHGRGSPPP